jgi:hypothetical protein
MNRGPAITYRDHLKPFKSLAMNASNIDLDSLVLGMQEGKYNIYNILSEFTSYCRIIIILNPYHILLYVIERL